MWADTCSQGVCTNLNSRLHRPLEPQVVLISKLPEKQVTAQEEPREVSVHWRTPLNDAGQRRAEAACFACTACTACTACAACHCVACTVCAVCALAD